MITKFIMFFFWYTSCLSVISFTVCLYVYKMYIQQLKDGKWHTLDSHRYSFDNWHASKEITYSPCPHGYTYRLKCSYYVYSNGYYDNIDATTANFVYK